VIRPASDFVFSRCVFPPFAYLLDHDGHLLQGTKYNVTDYKDIYAKLITLEGQKLPSLYFVNIHNIGNIRDILCHSSLSF
jgi:hypothetical protein